MEDRAAAYAGSTLPRQHFLYILPLAHGQRSLRPVFAFANARLTGRREAEVAATGPIVQNEETIRRFIHREGADRARAILAYSRAYGGR